MWAGSAYPESIFLGAAICWVLNGFSGPNYTNNIKRNKSELLICYFYAWKKSKQKEQQNRNTKNRENSYVFQKR